jgi:hypothetical protein
MSLYIAGTPWKTLTPADSITSTACCTSHEGNGMYVPPANNTEFIVTVIP